MTTLDTSVPGRSARVLLCTALAVAFLAPDNASAQRRRAQREPVALEGAEPVLSAETVARIKAEGLENSRVMEHLDGLTNRIGHRLTGSDNFTLATRWARDRFEAMGLENAHLEQWATWPYVWNRGQWSGRVVEPEKLELQVATAAWTAGTKGRVRGRLLRAPESEEEAARMANDLAGAWLWVDSFPGGRRRRGGGSDEWLLEVAEETGIAGFVSSSRGDRNYPNRIRVFGSAPRTADAKLPTIPQVVVRADQAERLEELLDAREDVVVEFDLRNRIRREPVDLHNVIAEIPGTTRPDEVVVVCAHLDSWHQATGTTDNGTGSATTLECARILSAIGAKPMRTIRFCLWGGEEQGLLGSREYVRQHRDEMPSISFVFNHDTGTNWWQNMTIDEGNVEAMRRVFAPTLGMTAPDAEHDGPVFALYSASRISGGGGSDHASFIAAGVPATSIGLTGRSDYFGFTWHTQWDTYDVAIPEYQRHTATMLALAALGVANLPEQLTQEGVQRRSDRRGGGRQLLPALEGLLGCDLGGDGDLTFVEIDPEGRAAKLGFQKGDVLKQVGRQTDNLLVTMFRARTYDREITIKVTRGGEEVSFTIPGSWGSLEVGGDDGN